MHVRFAQAVGAHNHLVRRQGIEELIRNEHAFKRRWKRFAGRLQTIGYVEAVSLAWTIMIIDGARKGRSLSGAGAGAGVDEVQPDPIV
jgi:hypothetical protein